MPTTIRADILKLVDKSGKPLLSVDFIDPSNPLILIDPQIGKTYEAKVFLKNDSPYEILHVRLFHNYSDVKLEPTYIEFLKSNQIEEIKITWKPFTEKGITEKIKNGKVSVNFQPSCTVVVEQNA